ncbi:hypothetical protein EMPG_11963 [Blastomyces silverae]|uniref:Mid2 domain-containing protein n=1 Tax=Blastomyces silverae TaxID=2060906 RepID=A0A0H1BNG4_9EURO|nr:hypothetical protein EMPG_11963 [Blastomyces silverae]
MRRIPFHSPSRFSLLHAGLLTAYLSPLLLSTPAHAAGSKCYLPNGEVEKNDAPCFPQNPESACCGGSEYVCATNNMCAHHEGGYYVIGSCDHIHNSVYRCTDADDTYCCMDGPECNCTTNANTQKIFDFLPPYSVLVGSSVSLNTAAEPTSLFTPSGATPPPTTSTSATSSAESTESTASTTTGTQSTSATASRISSGSGTSGVNPTSAGGGAAGGPTPAPEVPVNQSNDSDLGMKIGLGVGIPLAVIAVLLAALVYRLWKRGAGRNVNAGPGSGPGDAGSGYASGGRAAAAGFFGWRRRKEDPTSSIPMLGNTPAAAEVPDTSMNQPPMNGHGFSQAFSYYKPDELATSQTPRPVHEVP